MKTFVGRITKDATVNKTKKDTEVVNFSIVEKRIYFTKEGDKKEEKNFYNCAYWIGTAVAKYLTKGTLIEVHGHLTADAYIDVNGKAKPQLKVHVIEIILHAKPNNKQAQENEQPVTQPEEVTEPVDDLPF